MGERSASEAQSARLTGITLAKQFPNSAEPLRGLFVLRQVLATAGEVDWTVIAPVPSAPAPLRGVSGRPVVTERDEVDGIKVFHPTYFVLPKRVRFEKAGESMARASARFFGPAVERGARFVHAHALFPSGAAAALLAHQADIPLVVTVHGSDLYTMLDRPAWRDAIAGVVDVAAVVICVGTKIAEDVRGEFGTAAEKVRVIPDAYDDATFRYMSRPRRAADQPVRLVSVGRLEPYKGVDLLVDAFAELLASAPEQPLELVLVGDGSERTRLQARASERGVAERVTFAGKLPPERIVEELSAAHLYVQPSRREGFGVALVEAQATGLPAVVTRSGGPEDIVTEESGLVVECESSALATGIRDMLSRLNGFDGEAIAARVRDRYGAATIGRQLVETYREVLGD